MKAQQEVNEEEPIDLYTRRIQCNTMKTYNTKHIYNPQLTHECDRKDDCKLYEGKVSEDGSVFYMKHCHKDFGKVDLSRIYGITKCYTLSYHCLSAENIHSTNEINEQKEKVEEKNKEEVKNENNEKKDNNNDNNVNNESNEKKNNNDDNNNENNKKNENKEDNNENNDGIEKNENNINHQNNTKNEKYRNTENNEIGVQTKDENEKKFNSVIVQTSFDNNLETEAVDKNGYSSNITNTNTIAHEFEKLKASKKKKVVENSIVTDPNNFSNVNTKTNKNKEEEPIEHVDILFSQNQNLKSSQNAINTLSQKKNDNVTNDDVFSLLNNPTFKFGKLELNKKISEIDEEKSKNFFKSNQNNTTGKFKNTEQNTDNDPFFNPPKDTNNNNLRNNPLFTFINNAEPSSYKSLLEQFKANQPKQNQNKENDDFYSYSENNPNKSGNIKKKTTNFDNIKSISQAIYDYRNKNSSNNFFSFTNDDKALPLDDAEINGVKAPRSIRELKSKFYSSFDMNREKTSLKDISGLIIDKNKEKDYWYTNDNNNRTQSIIYPINYKKFNWYIVDSIIYPSNNMHETALKIDNQQLFK